MKLFQISDEHNFWHAVTLAQARQWCEQAARSGEIVPVTLAALNGERPRANLALADWQSRYRRNEHWMALSGAVRVPTGARRRVGTYFFRYP